MEQKILTEIHIEGKEVLDFSSLTIRQYFNEHHHFELNVNHDTGYKSQNKLENQFSIWFKITDKIR